MRSVIAGTAGHIDHGKTALVKALTGIDADRLKEEKRRGITIDIGFAHLELPGENGETVRIGFVDVPGHERFVRNMLAGIGGIDLVLFVVAADESIKPQSREHFDICRLLNLNKGITVITKSDSVDRETLNMVRLEIGDFVRGSFLDFSRSPVVAVSSLTGEGLDLLRQELTTVSRAAGARDPNTFARIPIDRVFSMKGFGTVVTGTLISGTIRAGHELEVFPERKRVRVRGIQVHGKSVEVGVAGQRCALNLAGVSTGDLNRGMVLASGSTFQSTARVDVSLSLLPSAKSLKHRSRVHFHAHAMESVAEVFLYEEKKLLPGQEAFAQLRLAGPTLLLPRDRFIIRQFSPVETIGGGIVLDALPMTKIPSNTRMSFLKALAGGNPETILKVRIARQTDHGLTLKQAVAETGWTIERIEDLVAPPIENGEVSRVGDLFVCAGDMAGVRLLLVENVATFHASNPLVPGIGKESLRAGMRVSQEIFTAALDFLICEKKVEVAGDLVRLAGRTVVMRSEESESKRIIEDAFRSAGLKTPALEDVLSSLKIEKERSKKIVTLLLREKILVKISEDLIFHSSAIAHLRKLIAAEKLKSAQLDVARFKGLTGVSRKYAIPLLEYLDREHITRRIGDERVIV